MVSLIKVADACQKKRLVREEEERLRQEQLRLAREREARLREEKERQEMLEYEAERWAKSQQIRAFVEAVTKKANGFPDVEAHSAEISDWIEWAKRHADRIDPLLNGYPFLIEKEGGN
jgi:hypothetical protein